MFEQAVDVTILTASREPGAPDLPMLSDFQGPVRVYVVYALPAQVRARKKPSATFRAARLQDKSYQAR